MAVRIIKLISDEVGIVRLALFSLCIGIEVGNGHGIGVQLP